MGCAGNYRHILDSIMFRTHPDINLARMTFNHQPSIGEQVCTPEHFNLQYTQEWFIDS
jgi:hypothetical protein